MKKYIKSSKFDSNVVLKDMNGDIVCELEPDSGFYVIPAKIAPSILMAVGDTYTVEQIDTEIE